jgi:hypothetical protein
LKLFSILEPSITENMEQPPVPRGCSVAYHSVYLVILLANSFANVAGTYRHEPVPPLILSFIKTVAAIMFVFDLLVRTPLIASRRYVPALLLDLITSISEVILLTAGDMGVVEINYIPPLRATRVFLFTGLFIRTETFRDINLAIRTVVESLRSLLVFVVLVVIGLLMFSTFVYLSERGDWNSDEQRWYRECHPFLSVCKGFELSPFQSIPDSMWLIIQSMTTVGYGDVTPTSTLGRLVTGVAIISGVFVIAFPSMVLIGNLDQSRRDFFAQQERTELEKEYKETEAELEAGAAERTTDGRPTTVGTGLERTNATGFGATNMTSENDDSDEERVEFVPTRRAMLFGVLGDKALKKAVSRIDFGTCRPAIFAFMGDGSREVTRHPKGYWTYEPIFQILTDPEDNLPLLSNIMPNPEGGGFVGVITLIVDDPEAQALAVAAVEQLDPDSAEPMCHASPVYGLDVTFKRPVPDVILKRRVTTGLIHDHTVPITLELMQTESGSPLEFIASVRRALARAQLVLKYNRQPVTSATWIKNVPITSVMLSTTPFIQDLRAIAINIAPREYWGTSGRHAANQYARTRRNVAYITRRHLLILVYPIYKKVTTPSYVLRNVTDFIETVANIVRLHCREVRKHDVPVELQRCIYQGDSLGDFERLYEVDVDYFRTIDWPLGTVPCEYNERMMKRELIVRVGDSAKHDQPVLADLDAFRRADVNEGALDTGHGGGEVDVFGTDF